MVTVHALRKKPILRVQAPPVSEPFPRNAHHHMVIVKYHMPFYQILKEQGPTIFQKAKDQEKSELKELVDELYKQIGQLKVERDWLKKKSEIFT